MSLRRMWTLGVTLLLVVGGTLGVFANYQIDMYGARLAAYEWLRGARRNGPQAYDAELLARLSLDARTLAGDEAVASAIVRRDWGGVDAAARASWTTRRPNEQWIAIADGVAHGSLDGCQGADVAAAIGGRREGLVMCGDRPVLFATDERAEVEGARLYAARGIDDGYATALRQVSGAEIVVIEGSRTIATSLRDLHGEPLPLRIDDAAWARIRAPGEYFGPETLAVPSYRGYYNGTEPYHVGAPSFAAYILVAPLGPADHPVPAEVVFIAPRDILDLGALYSSLMLAGCAVLIVVLLVGGMGLLVRRVTRPLERLGEVAARLGAGDATARVGEVHGAREIAALAASFDGMAEKLAELRRAEALAVASAEERAEETGEALVRVRLAHEELRIAHGMLRQTQEKLVRASRQAGMAEVATSVLHNVGNVLNTVNVAVEVAQRRTASSKVTTLERAVAMMPAEPEALAAFHATDPRAAQLPKLLRLVTDALLEERRAIGSELQVLTRSIDHIKNIVRRQQQMASFDGATEIAAPADVVDMAVALLGAESGPRAIAIVRELEPLPPRAVDRHRMVQIVLNLLSNARHAVHAAAPGEPRIVVRLAADADGFRVEVADNGVGFEPELRTKLFEHGFTTKADGHGFGLHSSANAAVEMGGSLTAHSDGPGLGATFVLHVPTPAAVARAAA